MARIREAQGDPDGALTLLDEAERFYVGDFFPDVRPVAASKARVWVAQGRLADALAWARERGLSAEDAPSYLREFEHLTLARAAPRPPLRATGTSAPCGRRWDSWSACCRRPMRGAGRAASSKSWCCRRSPTGRAATSPPRWCRCDAP
jgi:hypothetical protein